MVPCTCAGQASKRASFYLMTRLTAEVCSTSPRTARTLGPTAAPAPWQVDSMALAGLRGHGPDGPDGRLSHAQVPEVAQGPAREAMCNDLRGGGRSHHPELWGLHPPHGLRGSTGQGGRDSTSRCARTPPTPALARAAAPHTCRAGPAPPPALRPRLALAAPPLPTPRGPAHIPHTPSTPRERRLVLRARWRFHLELRQT